MRADLKSLGDAVILAVKGYVARAHDGLALRIGELDARLKAMPKPERGEKGDRGDAGKDAEPIDVAHVIAEVAAQIPKPERGEKGDAGDRGNDGKDADAAAITASVLEKVTLALEKIPAPKDGRDGKDVDPAAVEEFIATQVRESIESLPKPKDGRDGVSEEQVSEMVQLVVAAEVSKAIGALQLPKDGLDGKDADPEVIRTEVARAVEAIPKPRDGQDADPRLVEVLVRSAVEAIPKPRDGVDGKDGRDGFDLKSFSASLNDDGRTVVMKLADEAHAVEVPLVFPVPLERGVFNAEATYSKGDGVIYDGSFWFAQKDAPSGKPGISSDWRLATKRGRDGKDGLRGEKGDRGAEGRAGKDLTQLGGSGAKW